MTSLWRGSELRLSVNLSSKSHDGQFLNLNMLISAYHQTLGKVFREFTDLRIPEQIIEQKHCCELQVQTPFELS